MKISQLLVSFLFVFSLVGSAYAARTFSEHVTLQVKQMECSSCAKKIEAKLNHLPGVRNVVISTKTHIVRVSYDKEKLQPADLITAIKTLDYDAVLVN